MQLKRCAQGFCFLVILLSSLAFVLDDVVLLFAAGAILAGLFFLLFSFDARVAAAASSVTVTRSAERTQVRKGTTLRIVTEISVAVPDHLAVRIRERLPGGVLVQDGETGALLTPQPDRQAIRLAYRITPAVHGNLQYGGLLLSASDLFFATDIELTAGRFRMPVLYVQPRGIFEPGYRQETLESREVEKMAALTGFGIRAIRDYLSGDDLRRIDWKLSAKHNKLLVREYTGVISLPPLIIVDLPWQGMPVSGPAFDRMVSSVTGLAGYSARMFQSVSVLVISGPNILQVLHEEKDLEQCISRFREWLHPAGRTDHLYRFSDRGDLRGRLRVAERLLETSSGSDAGSFLSALRRTFLTTVPAQSGLSFSSQLARILKGSATDEVHLYSLAEGDASHLRQVIRVAQGARLRVHLRVPDIAQGTRILRQGKSTPDTVEAFA